MISPDEYMPDRLANYNLDILWRLDNFLNVLGSIGGMGFVPDMDNDDYINLIDTNYGSWMADKDGFVICTIHSQSTAIGQSAIHEISINSKTIFINTNNNLLSGDRTLTTQVIPIKKGQSIALNSNGTDTFDKCYCFYVPPVSVLLPTIPDAPKDGSPYGRKDGKWDKISSGGGGGGSSLANSPHLWELDTEIDLGDGSFGFAKSGTITQEADTTSEETVFEPNDQIYIINYGGYWCDDSWTYFGIPGVNPYYGELKVWSGIECTGSWVGLATRSNNARTNKPFFVWVRYTKK